MDNDQDKKLEFGDMMVFLFSLEETMSKEDYLKRSFQLFDRNGSGKISKEEMIDVLAKLGKITIDLFYIYYRYRDYINVSDISDF